MRRTTRIGLIGASCWLGLVGLAVFVFVTVHEPIGRFGGHLYDLEEPIGFAWGFAVSGASCGSVSLGVLGGPRRGIVMALAILVVLGLIAAGMILGLPELAVRWYGMSPQRFDSYQRALISCFRIGSILGLASGAIAAPIMAGLTELSRLVGIRRPWFVMVALLAPASVVSIPLATSRVSELAGLLHLNYWSSDDEAILGASIGSTTGAFAGFLLMLLLSRITTPQSPDPPESPS